MKKKKRFFNSFCHSALCIHVLW